MATLKELRGQKFITQAELAKKAEIGRDTVNQVERGRQKPSFLTIRKLAAALGVAPGQIEFPGSVENSPVREPALQAPSDEELARRKKSTALWNRPAPSIPPQSPPADKVDESKRRFQL